MIDLVGPKQGKVIDLGALRGPHGLDFGQGKVWFTAEAAKVIGSYDPTTDKIDWVMGTGQNRTHMIYVFPMRRRSLRRTSVPQRSRFWEHTERPPDAARSACGRSGWNAGGACGGPPGPPGGDWNETVIPVGRGAEGFDVSPDHKQAWVANAGDGTIR